MAEKMYSIDRSVAIENAKDQIGAKLQWVRFSDVPTDVRDRYQRWAGLALEASQVRFDMETGDFHETAGWYFKRLADGTVRVRVSGYGEHTMSPNSWASVVAHVSKRGETGESYQAALDFHETGATYYRDLAEIGQLFATVYPDGSMSISGAIGRIPAASFPVVYKHAKRKDSPQSAFELPASSQQDAT